eukprot:12699541-Alexandrium_andersonii.AAC.1
MGPVWSSLPQSSQAAEFCAYGAVAEVASRAYAVVTDCQNVQDSALSDGWLRYSPKRMYSSIVRHHDVQPAAAMCLAVGKVKSHCSMATARSALESRFIAGNDIADMKAADAASAHESLGHVIELADDL